MIIIILILLFVWVFGVQCAVYTVNSKASSCETLEHLNCSTYEIFGSLLYCRFVSTLFKWNENKKGDNFNKRWTFSAVSLFPWLCVFWSRKCLENNLTSDNYLNFVENNILYFVVYLSFLNMSVLYSIGLHLIDLTFGRNLLIVVVVVFVWNWWFLNMEKVRKKYQLKSNRIYAW